MHWKDIYWSGGNTCYFGNKDKIMEKQVWKGICPICNKHYKEEPLRQYELLINVRKYYLQCVHCKNKIIKIEGKVR